MSKVLVTEQYLTDIGNAIRAKKSVATTYKPSEMAGAVESIETGITPTGTKNITTNGTHDVTNFASAEVAVPNSFSASDEGKVVSNGALVAQTAQTVTENGTYDTTLKNSVVVNVEGGGGGGSGGGGVLVEPEYQGLAKFYVYRDGVRLGTESAGKQSINIFKVSANKKYALFVGETVGTRRRAGFFAGLTMSDLQPYISTDHGNDNVIATNGTWLAPFTAGTEDTGNALAGRIIFTPTSDGLVVYGTSNDGTVVPAYCVDMSASGGGGSG